MQWPCIAENGRAKPCTHGGKFQSACHLVRGGTYAPERGRLTAREETEGPKRCLPPLCFSHFHTHTQKYLNTDLYEKAWESPWTMEEVKDEWGKAPGHNPAYCWPSACLSHRVLLGRLQLLASLEKARGCCN